MTPPSVRPADIDHGTLAQVFVLRLPVSDTCAFVDHVNDGVTSSHDSLQAAFAWINARLGGPAPGLAPDRHH